MFRQRLVVTRFALGIVAVENIVKRELGFQYDPIFDFDDDFSDFDRDDWRDFPAECDAECDNPCHCLYCRRGEYAKCVNFFDDDDDDMGIFSGMEESWAEEEFVFSLAADGAVPFDDIPVPIARVNKRTRTSWNKGMKRNVPTRTSYLHAREHEERKLRFMVPRRKRTRIGLILAHEESAERALWAESEARYWDAYFPEDSVELRPKQKAELLKRNFPALSASSVQRIASSWRIQASSTFSGLEQLRQYEAEEERRNVKYFHRLDELDYDGSMYDCHELIDMLNRIACISLRG